MLQQINHDLFTEEDKTAEIRLAVDYNETWRNEKSELLQEMLGKKIAEGIKDRLNVIYDTARVSLVNEFEAKLMLKQVKYLHRTLNVETVEEFVSIADEVLNDDYDGMDIKKANDSTSPKVRKQIRNCGTTLARILEDHVSDSWYDLDVLNED